jgi:plasmid stabilization system protein ParE
MRFSVEFAAPAERDLELIFQFLMQSYLDFGEERSRAYTRAAERVAAIVRAGIALGAAPHQGTLRAELQTGLRSVTKGRAIFYFEVSDEKKLVRVLAVFFGGQDHQRAMLKRLRGG